MITNLNASYDNGTFYLKADALCGVSADTKPTNVGNGSIFREIDTGKIYMYDAGGQTWYEQPSPGGGGGGDDSGLFIVNAAYTLGEISMDKTLAETIAADAAGKIVVIRIPDEGRVLPFFDDDGVAHWTTSYIEETGESVYEQYTTDFAWSDDGESETITRSYYYVTLTPDE